MVRTHFGLAIIFFFTCAVPGQGEQNVKVHVPKDLLIQLTADASWPGADSSYRLTITSDGTWFYDGYRGYFVGRFTPQELVEANRMRLEKRGKAPRFSVPVDRLTKADLLELVAKFAEIDFLNLKDKYGQEEKDPANNNEPCGCIPHASRETISYTTDGRTQTVENHTGCQSPISAKLKALGEAIRNRLKFR